MNYDKYLIFKNIRTLLEKGEVKLGNIEAESHNQPGYMSRLEKADNVTEPNFEFIATASKMLGISLDILVFSDLTEFNESELTLLKFINSILEKTRSGKLFWEKTSDITQYECKMGNYHILIKKALSERPLYTLALNGDKIFDFTNGNQLINKTIDTLFKEIEIQTAEYRIRPQTKDLMTQFMNEKE